MFLLKILLWKWGFICPTVSFEEDGEVLYFEVFGRKYMTDNQEKYIYPTIYRFPHGTKVSFGLMCKFIDLLNCYKKTTKLRLEDTADIHHKRDQSLDDVIKKAFEKFYKNT